jgi:VanZ family protein
MLATYAAAIVALSSIPSHRFPTSDLWSFDKVLHMIEYTGLGLLLCRAMTLATARPIAYLAAFVVAAGFGVLDELYQSTTPGRNSSAFDAIADCAGAAVGVALWWVILRSWRRFAATAESNRSSAPTPSSQRPLS